MCKKYFIYFVIIATLELSTDDNFVIDKAQNRHANDEVGKYSRVSLLNLHHLSVLLLNAWKCIEFLGLPTQD